MFSMYLFVLLVVVLSMDAFVAGLSYGIEKVKVPLMSVFIIALLSGSMLTLSLLAGNFFLELIPEKFTKGISFSILFLLSLYKFYDAVPRPENIPHKINKEDKSILSYKEAAFLALALSIDNISAGLCTGTVSIPPMILLISTTAIHFLSIRLGLYAGRLLSARSSYNFAWLGAAILMFLSFLRLF